MRDGWERVPLGEVTQQIIEPVNIAADGTYSNLGLRMYAGGVFVREAKSGSEIKASRLFRVRAGQFIYNRLFAGGGSFGLVKPEHEHGVVSNEFPAFDLDLDRLLPEYLYLHFQQPSTWETVAEQCIGTTQTRLRWKEDRFRAYAIPLPPPHEQRRIVDLIGALDDTIAATDAGVLAAAQVLDASRDHFVRTHEAALVVGDVARVLRGAVWSKTDEAEQPATDYEEVVGISVTSATGLDLTKMKYVKGLGPKTHRLEARDLLLVGSNGNPDRIGNVYDVSSLAGRPFSAFQMALRPLGEEISSRLLFHALASPSLQRLMTEKTAGSTGLKNLGVKGLRNVPLPSIPANETAAWVTRLDASEEVVTKSQELSARLRTLRSNLLTALLSGEHEIPKSYDELMEDAAA